MKAIDRIRWSLVASGVLLAAGISLLLGLPGAFFIEAADNLLASSGISTFRGDKAWPAAIYVTAAMPLGVVLSAVVLARVAPDAGFGRSFLWAAVGYILVGIATTTLLILLG
jgi:hypothetical protein